MQGRMNIPVRGGGEGSSLNVFAQDAEPATKDGIWINTSNMADFEYDDIEITNTDYYDTSNVFTSLTKIPYSFYYGSAVAIGTDIYLLGGSGSNTKAYKYDTITGTYTQLTNIPYNFYKASAVAVGTDIYLLGSNSSSNITKK
jgi:hypothetical protein